jgi:glucokinase
VSECYSGLFIYSKASLIHKDLLTRREFMEIFEQHDKRTDVLRKVPVYLIVNPDVGLYGCCNVTVNFYNL